MKNAKIVTVGISPCWDIRCEVDGIGWGDNKVIAGQSVVPAGKALNVSRALDWIGVSSTAAGLWGAEDYDEMLRQMAGSGKLVRCRFTPAPGRTRRNVTIVDRKKNKEMHLRAQCALATGKTLKKLRGDLKKLVGKFSVCVFSGSLPEGDLLENVLEVISVCRNEGGRIVVDTSGPALKRILQEGEVWLVKPNVMELQQVAGKLQKITREGLVEKAESLLDKATRVLLSCGADGALLVKEEGVRQVGLKGKGQPVVSTVGCGDYLLAGFLGELARSGDERIALVRGVQAGTARAWGMTGAWNWNQTQRKVKVE